MKKQEILESLLALINEEIDRAVNEDEALKMSDERRAIFKDTVFSNPPAYNSAGKLQEADSSVPPEPEVQDVGNAPKPAMPDMGTAPAMDGGGVDPAAVTGGSAPEIGGAPGGGPMPDDGMEDGEDPAMDDAGGDLGGGGGGMGGFGGGGGGGGMDFGGEGGEEGAEGGEPPPEPQSFDPFKDSENLEDKLQVILDTAEEIANQTQDPQKVLKALKGMIQNGFENPEKAARAISDLFDTDNPVLQQVSRRLALFTWGV